MKIKPIVISFILALLGFPALTVLHAADATKTVVIVANDTLKFSVTRIDAHPGEQIHVQLRNEGTMPKAGMGHNWILLKADADLGKFAMAAISARDNEYVPKALQSEIIASIPLLGPKEVGDVTFSCPITPGKYPFICSCNGHSMAGMRGDLIVK